MSNAAITRENVQSFLDSNAARIKYDILEDQARELRLIINKNHTTKTGSQPAAPRKKKRRDPSRDVERMKEKRAQRAAEAAYCADWYLFMLRVFTPLLFAALAVELAWFGVIHIFLAIPIAAVACTFSVKIFADRLINPCIYQ